MRWFALLFFGQVPQYLSGQHFVDLAVPGDRLCRPCLRVVVNVMLAAMADQPGAGGFCLRNEVTPLHANSNSSTFLIPGISSELNVSYKSRR